MEPNNQCFFCREWFYSRYDLELPICFGLNNVIDGDDFQSLALNYLNNNSSLDINSDNKINAIEFAYLVSYWGQNCTH